ncbi:VPS4-associated protein 1 [Filobasidium floriforme]|uniref:VPS4-associated protein 1 n=1 Tax=Filobasidium floriforme TaxID=5210 RepID=UPI001E8CFCC6|nr:VPS4-associated protein 1 [Filobasidium floriforme]KAH8079752.1 VPS4-associated protein 1 [Filobasidium floriforme]
MAQLQNVYYERKAATPKQCYVCRTPTTTVLSTVNTVSWIYVCPKHLDDPGFATLIPQPETPAGPSKEDIAKVIEEHRQREVRRTEESKNKTDDAGKDDDAKAKEKGIPSDKPKSSSNEAPPIGIPDSSSSGPAAVKHRQFALHRGIFSMLEREAKGREQGAKAKEVGKGLPHVPRTQF